MKQILRILRNTVRNFAKTLQTNLESEKLSKNEAKFVMLRKTGPIFGELRKLEPNFTKLTEAKAKFL